MLVRTGGLQGGGVSRQRAAGAGRGSCPAPARRARSGGLTASVPAAESRL